MAFTASLLLLATLSPWHLCSASEKPLIPLTLSINQIKLQTGDVLSAKLDSIDLTNDLPVDVYLALASQNELFFISPASTLTKLVSSFRRDVKANEIKNLPINILIDQNLPAESYQFYALLVMAGQDVSKASSWASELVSQPLTILPFHIRLDSLKDEPYLLSARHPVDGSSRMISVQKWDVLFFGSSPFDTGLSESNLFGSVIIPGDFSHIAIYLGRDEQGRACAMELTINLLKNNPYSMALTYLPENNDTVIPTSSNILPAMPKDISSYHFRWAKRFIPSELTKIKAAEAKLLAQIQQDWENRFPYQLEFELASAFFNRQFCLVDDGRQNGASCTDYWLDLFEEIGGVCIKGSRINASELKAQYFNSPEGSVQIYLDLGFIRLNFSPKELLEGGFTIVDPPPHVFQCDKTSETGLPIPDMLFQSPQLEEII